MTTFIHSAISKLLMNNGEVRKTTGIKLKPSIARKARVGAARSDKRLGEWIEEAIGEKVAREEREETQPK